jgi:signal transduction histidine kinase
VIDRLVIIAFVALLGISLAVAAALARARAEAARLLPPDSPAAQGPSVALATTHSAPEAAPTLVLAPARPAEVAPSPRRMLPTEDVATPNDLPENVDWLAQAIDELRTPLGILRGQVEALRRAAPEGPRHTLVTLATRLVEQVEQAQELVAAWSASIQGNPASRTDHALHAVEIIALARQVGAEAIGAACDVAPTAPLWAALDPAPLARALAVILHSAHTAAPEGLVEVVARSVGRDPDRRIGITIADRRPASPSPSARLWDDLELDLIRTLLEECGGWVTSEARGGGGRLVTVWLPGALLRTAEIQPALAQSA